MTAKTVQIYPSPENSQRTNDDAVPFDFAAAMLGKIAGTVPQAERASLTITGWKGLRLVYTHTPTPAERQAERLELLEAALRAASRDGLTAEQTVQLLAAAGRV